MVGVSSLAKNSRVKLKQDSESLCAINSDFRELHSRTRNQDADGETASSLVVIPYFFATTNSPGNAVSALVPQRAMAEHEISSMFCCFAPSRCKNLCGVQHPEVRPWGGRWYRTARNSHTQNNSICERRSATGQHAYKILLATMPLRKRYNSMRNKVLIYQEVFLLIRLTSPAFHVMLLMTRSPSFPTVRRSALHGLLGLIVVVGRSSSLGGSRHGSSLLFSTLRSSSSSSLGCLRRLDAVAIGGARLGRIVLGSRGCRLLAAGSSGAVCVGWFAGSHFSKFGVVVSYDGEVVRATFERQQGG